MLPGGLWSINMATCCPEPTICEAAVSQAAASHSRLARAVATFRSMLLIAIERGCYLVGLEAASDPNLHGDHHGR